MTETIRERIVEILRDIAEAGLYLIAAYWLFKDRPGDAAMSTCLGLIIRIGRIERRIARAAIKAYVSGGEG